jgi:hypothetical protein
MVVIARGDDHGLARPEPRAIMERTRCHRNCWSWSRDVAVLQLEDGGSELPIEWNLATPAELDELFAATIGILGYPGHSAQRGRMDRPSPAGPGGPRPAGRQMEMGRPLGCGARRPRFVVRLAPQRREAFP